LRCFEIDVASTTAPHPFHWHVKVAVLMSEGTAERVAAVAEVEVAMLPSRDTGVEGAANEDDVGSHKWKPRGAEAGANRFWFDKDEKSLKKDMSLGFEKADMSQMGSIPRFDVEAALPELNSGIGCSNSQNELS
jgi:hypothetical protein